MKRTCVTDVLMNVTCNVVFGMFLWLFLPFFLALLSHEWYIGKFDKNLFRSFIYNTSFCWCDQHFWEIHSLSCSCFWPHLFHQCFDRNYNCFVLFVGFQFQYSVLCRFNGAYLVLNVLFKKWLSVLISFSIDLSLVFMVYSAPQIVSSAYEDLHFTLLRLNHIQYYQSLI